MKLPADLQYTLEHLWVNKTEDGHWLAGITDYAQDLLGDVVYIEPPKIGDSINSGKPCGLVESVKAGSDLHAPLNGEVTEINQALLDAPEDINDTPYKAWIFKFKPENSDDISELLSAEAYEKHIGSI